MTDYIDAAMEDVTTPIAQAVARWVRGPHLQGAHVLQQVSLP